MSRILNRRTMLKGLGAAVALPCDGKNWLAVQLQVARAGKPVRPQPFDFLYSVGDAVTLPEAAELWIASMQ
jgi:hypothetical protein